MIKILLKFVFAIALLYWLITSGKLDLSLVMKSFEVGPQWFMAFLLIIIIVALGAYRYKLLLETKSQKTLRFFDVLRLNYIGLFFSSVLPGAVTGDLIKLVYIKKLDQGFTKTFLVTVTLLDRIIGLAGLLFLAGGFSLIYFSEVTVLSPKIAHVIQLNLFLFGGTILFLGTLISPYKFQKMIVNLIKKIPFIGKKISELLDHLFALRENRKDLINCFLLSILTQFLSILAFWTISSPFYSGHLPLQYAFTFIPVGLIATAVPISPGGLGVGHVLFANLFSFVNIDNGASLFNLFFLCSFSHNFLGVIPYLLAGRKTLKEKEAI
ncbi:MAG: lysylphosphatidylglycerol synthase transmembrane domain-containing protein [Bacteriovorax sp.]|nr:lysylphosphatidylglycerol synthase transmembrane domain-containing protein [Bacteriovorax sp.]